MNQSLKKLIQQQAPQCAELEHRLGHHFNNPELLVRSLTHRSYSFEHSELPGCDNETLEFLGDAVLDLIVGFLLFQHYPREPEGILTKMRSALVQEGGLTIVARQLDLGRYILLGRGEDNNGGRAKPSILSCAYEAVIGAVFVDAGYEAARRVVEKHFIDRLQLNNKTQITDAKSRLQELTQRHGGPAPTYSLVNSSGPDHNKSFTVSVLLNGEELASATAGNKKAAEQKAAAMALHQFSPK
ncbi:ribonuclease III [Desulfobacterota bacterium M19]